ncbi:AraC family transcriptional regulator [Leptolyngbya sp. FACHB-711]|uniref:AraC family transcriptional regulator n=1 Tax=unclassified Leptolyngbya TaxID=2650499 RepID=UPI001688C660|nr:AraC family transcriptional regulator [Leptolyngbya sp. FACHB-711]MBD1848503.1 AraC family transcriptional regulator [Cyanobacteria bacterium FACHB-502]MBD2025506.1 AraC family transcriptional regulator [Leptolyngbya sp. FACHB-711]
MADEALKRKTTIDACQALAELVNRHTDGKGNGTHATAIPQLEFMRESTASTALRAVYEPTLCIIVQGQKETLLGQETYHYGAAQYLVVTVDLPLSGYIVEATPDKPYLCFKLSLDATQLWEIIDQLQRSPDKKESSVRGLFVSDVNAPLIECATRLARLLDTPEDIPFLAPMMIRELYYRLLMSEQNEAVWQIATSGSHMQRIAAVINQIKAEFTKPLSMDDLAKQARMSSATFHRHFKAVTSMSPLQYQKQLRLLEARRLMLTENADATQAAYQVGYESPSQFSREYSRMFGTPPMKDVERLRVA